MPSVLRQAEDVLEDVLLTVRAEYESPCPVLCESDRKEFVDKEESLRKRVKEMKESETCSWQNLFGLISPQAARRCLEDAEGLRQRVKEDIDEKLRTRLAGKSSPPPLSSHGRGPAANLIPGNTSRTSGDDPALHVLPDATRSIITSPLNMNPPLPEISQGLDNPAIRNDNNYTSDLNEAINTPLETSSDRSSNSSTRRHRRSPPPPPLRQMVQSGSLHHLSESTSDLGGRSPRRSNSVRRPAPPPPQSTRQPRAPRSPTNGSFPPASPLSLNRNTISSISGLTQQVDKLLSTVVKESLSSQAHGGRGLRSGESRVTKTNCVDIVNSNVDGVTVTNGGTNNSGAVIHKTVLPQRLAQPVPPV